MAQTAAQTFFLGMDATESYEEIKKEVVETLSLYPKLNALINVAKRRSEGKGLHIKKIDITPEQHQYLKTVGRAYTADASGDYMHKEKAEKLFQKLAEENARDFESLDAISGLMTGATPFSGEGYAYNGKVYPTQEAAVEQAKEDAFQEMLRLHNLKQTIEEAMNDLKSYAPHLEKLLRMRYFEEEIITAVCTTLKIQPRTQDNWHREAVIEIGTLLGVSRGW